MYEKSGCHANSNYFFQLLNQDFCDDLHVRGCEGVIYIHGNFSLPLVSKARQDKFYLAAQNNTMAVIKID